MGKNRGSQALRLHKQQQERAEKERQKKAEAFLADYHELVKKHGIDWTCELHFTPQGLTPRLRLKEATPPPAVTSWPEAQRQNLETRKECTHELNEEHGNCSQCGLEKDNWGSEGKGVTEEYEAKKTKEIEDALAKQNEPKQEEAPAEEAAEEAEEEDSEEGVAEQEEK